MRIGSLALCDEEEEEREREHREDRRLYIDEMGRTESEGEDII